MNGLATGPAWLTPLWGARLAAALFLFLLAFAHTVSLRLIGLGAALLLTLWLAWPRRRELVWPPWGVPLLLWVGVALGSLVWAWEPRESLRALKGDLGYGLAAWLLFHLLTPGVAAARGFLLVMLAAAGVLFVSAVTGALGGWPSLAVLYQAAGVVQFNSFLLALIPLLVFGLLAAGRAGFRRDAAVVAGACLLGVGFFVHQRIYWLMLAAQFLVVVGLLQWRWRWLTGRGLAGVALALALWGGMLGLTLMERTYGQNLERAASWGEVVWHHWQDERFDLWRGAVAEIQAHPWIGKGYGRFGDYPFCSKFEGRRMPCHAHNLFLDALLQMGWPGLAALLTLLGSMGATYWRWYRDPNEVASLAGVCGLTLLVGLVVRNFTNDHFAQEAALLFWSVTGMLTGVGLAHRQAD